MNGSPCKTRLFFGRTDGITRARYVDSSVFEGADEYRRAPPMTCPTHSPTLGLRALNG